MSSSNSSDRTVKEAVSSHSSSILKKLDCDKTVRDETMSIIERADKQGLLTRGRPKGLAAGAVYIACILGEDRMTLDTIGSVVNLSGSTVGKYYMELARALGFSER